jgi:hypothetical protein
MRVRSFANAYKIIPGVTLCETALSGVTAIPASGYYVDVSGYEYCHIIMHLGTLHASDTPVFTPKCSDSVSGTADVIDATSGIVHTCNVTADDGQMVVWSIETAHLPTDHHFLLLAVSGTVSNGSYADPIFLLEGRHIPVTQDAVTPAAHVYEWVG